MIITSNNKKTISESVIKKLLTKSIKLKKVFIFDSIDSTNNFAKKIELSDNEYALVIARSQTNGRGRLGRNFFSPKDTGIYLSIVYKQNSFNENIINITSIAAVSVLKTLKPYTTDSIKIKWVNDLYVGNKKFCGILTEGITNIESGLIDRIIIGIGINISTNSFPDELSSIATNININNASYNEIISNIINNLYYYIESSSNEYIDIYKQYSLVLNKNIIFYKNNTPYYARVIDINEKCELVVENENKEVEILRTGDISVRLNEAN